MTTAAWTRWTAALVWGEALCDWHSDTDPSTTSAGRDERAAVMVLVALGIAAAAADRELVVTHPDALGELPLTNLYVQHLEDAQLRASLAVGELGPAEGEPGVAEHVRLADFAAASEGQEWRRLLTRAQDVALAHTMAAAGGAEQVVRLADRKGELAAHQDRRA